MGKKLNTSEKLDNNNSNNSNNSNDSNNNTGDEIINKEGIKNLKKVDEPKKDYSEIDKIIIKNISNILVKNSNDFISFLQNFSINSVNLLNDRNPIDYFSYLIQLLEYNNFDDSILKYCYLNYPVLFNDLFLFINELYNNDKIDAGYLGISDEEFNNIIDQEKKSIKEQYAPSLINVIIYNILKRINENSLKNNTVDNTEFSKYEDIKNKKRKSAEGNKSSEKEKSKEEKEDEQNEQNKQSKQEKEKNDEPSSDYLNPEIIKNNKTSKKNNNDKILLNGLYVLIGLSLLYLGYRLLTSNNKKSSNTLLGEGSGEGLGSVGSNVDSNTSIFKL